MSHINRAIPNHPLIGTVHVFGADREPYDPDAPENRRGGTVVVGNGMSVTVKAVFQNWNGVPGLDMLYVFCPATGQHTHLSPRELDLKAPRVE